MGLGFWSNSQGESVKPGGQPAPGLGGEEWVRGTRRAPIHEGSCTASMPYTVPRTHSSPPLTVGRRPWISQRKDPQLPTSISESQQPDPRRQARATQIQPHCHFIVQTLSLTGQETVGGWWGWVTGALHRMDAMAELTRVRAHCLRGTASHASERTAAGGWAGPRSGTCSVPRLPTPTSPASRTDPARRQALAIAPAPALGFSASKKNKPHKQEKARIFRSAPGGGRGREDLPPPLPRCCPISTSGSATSRSRSASPACPAAAHSPAAWPAHRRSCRSSGRTPGSPSRWPRSSAACAPE